MKSTTMRNTGILCVYMFLIMCFALSTAAATCTQTSGVPCYISITNARLASGNGTCNSTLTFTAQVNDYYNSSNMGITKVTFYVDLTGAGGFSRTPITATRTTGTAISGNWSATYVVNPVTDTLGITYRLVGIDAYNTADGFCGREASGGNKNDVDCIVTFNNTFGSYTGMAVNNSCTCLASISQSTCTIYNLLNLTWNVPAGCAGAFTTAQYECDFCDPLWIPKYENCILNNYASMIGGTKKKYDHGVGTGYNGSGCCDKTAIGAGNTIYNHNSGADCKMPADNGVDTDCYVDSWTLESGNSRKITPGSNSWPTANGNPEAEFQSPGFDDAIYSEKTGTGQTGDRVTPVAFDIDYDGKLEAVVANTIYNKLEAISTSSLGVLTIERSTSLSGYTNGQLAIFGISAGSAGDYGHYICKDGTSGQCSVGVAVPLTNSVAFYNVSGTSAWNLVNTVSVGGDISGNGVMCYLDQCYVNRKDGYLISINITSWVVTGIYYQGFKGYSGNDAVNTTPIIASNAQDASFGPIVPIQREFLWVFSSNGTIGFLAKFNATDGGSYMSVENFDGYPVGAFATPEWSDVDSSLVPVVYMTVRNEVAAGGNKEYLIYKYKYNSLNTEKLSSVLWIGYLEGCLSNPVQAKCGTDSQGVAIQKYNSKDSSVPGAFPYTFGTGLPGGAALSAVPESSSYDVGSNSRGYQVNNVNVIGNVGSYVWALDPENSGVGQVWYIDTSNILRAYSLDLSTAYVSTVNLGAALVGAPLVADIDYDGRTEIMLPFATGIRIYSMVNSVFQQDFSYSVNLTQYPTEKLTYDEDQKWGERSLAWGTDKYPYIWKIVSSYSSPGTFNAYFKNMSVTFPNLPQNAATNTYAYDFGRSLDGVEKAALMLHVNLSNYVHTVYELEFKGAMTFLRNYTLSKSGTWGGNDYNGPMAPSYTANDVYIIDSALNSGGILLLKSGSTCCEASSLGECVGVGGYNCGAYVYGYSTSVFPLSIYVGLGCGGLGGGAYTVSCAYKRLGDSEFLVTSGGGNCVPVAQNRFVDFAYNHAGSAIAPSTKAYAGCAACGAGCFVGVSMPIVMDYTGTNGYTKKWREGWGATDSGTGKIDYRVNPIPTLMGTWVLSDLLTGNVPTISATSSFPYDFNGDGNTDWFSTDRIYYNNITGYTPASYTSGIDCYDRTLTFQGKIPLSGTTCASKYISAISNAVGSDSYTEIISDKIYNFETASSIKDLLSGANTVSIPIAMESNGYGGIFSSTGSKVASYRPNAAGEIVTLAANLTLNKLQPCQVDSNGVLSLGIGASAPDYNVVYSMDPGDGISSGITQYYPNWNFKYTYSYPGNFTVTGKACNYGVCQEQTCNVQVSIADARVGSCNWGTEGDFDYSDSINQHGWVASPSLAITPGRDGVITFPSSQSIGIIRSASCDKAGIGVEQRIYIDETTDADITLNGGAKGEMMIAVKIQDGYLSALIDKQWVRQKEFTDGWHIVNITTDISSKKFTVTLDGVDVVGGIFPAVSPILDNYQSYYKIYHESGILLVDYVRLFSVGSRIDNRVTRLSDLADLGCTGVLPVCSTNVSYMSAAKASNLEEAYPNIAKYCHDNCGGMCDLDKMQAIVSVDPGCAKEITNYCIGYYYPMTYGSTGNSATEGMAVCSVVLGTNFMTDKLVNPIAGSIWKIIGNSWLSILIILFILVLVFAFKPVKK